MLETDTRKRPSQDPIAPPPTKKRALTGENGSPILVNGNAPATPSPEGDEPRDQDDLEQFRKEAIWRRMKHYSREVERSNARVVELERVKASYEANLAAIGSSWGQIIDAVRDLGSHNEADEVHSSAEELLELARANISGKDDGLEEALHIKAEATKALLSRLTRSSSEPDDMRQKYLQSQSELASLRAQLAVSQGALKDVRTQRDELHRDLQTANTRLDRQNSRTVRATNPRSASAAPEVANGDVKQEPASATPTPARSPLPNVEGSEDLQHLRDACEAMHTSKTNLEQEVTRIRDELHNARAEASRNASTLSEEQIQSSPFYQAIVLKAAALAESNRELQESLDERTRFATSLQAKFEEDLSTYEADGKKMEQNLVALADKRDADLARIRGVRDEIAAQNRELKAREELKFRSADEMQKLADTRAARIEVLQSELARVKSLIAAKAGDESLAAFLAAEQSGDITYVESLKERLSQAESEATAMRSTLESLDLERPDLASHLRSEADARRQLAAATDLLSRYRATYGESSSLPPQTRELSEQLKRKEEELKGLRLQDSQREQGEAALYSELDALTTAWESAEQQLKSKVLDLKGMEDQMRRAATEVRCLFIQSVPVSNIIQKAKMENKLYAAMNAKDAAVSEAKALKRSNDKEQKVIATLQEAKKMQDQLITQTKSTLAKAEAHADVLARRELDAKRKLSEIEVQLAQANIQAQKAHSMYKSLSQEHAQSERLRRKAEEQCKVTQKEAERVKETLKSRPESSSQKEDQLKAEVQSYSSLLRCSTCRENFRSVYLAKCSHTFCKSCIDTRYASRQRKCPSCQLPFGQADIQTLYFQ
ncbi:hypothetical protein PENSPDRAFT_205699 [Peniophora sp. CONT]|nr:hypothetical protein PENSPDRAFT_205699 [Peniophora sp. CONT]